MTALIDTHTFLWMVDDESRLSAASPAFVKDPANRLLLSITSAWEIAIKVGNGRLTIGVSLHDLLTSVLGTLSIDLIAITPAHFVSVSSLPDHHRDPFDRLIAAQFIVEALPIVSVDSALDAYGVTRIW